MAVPVGVILPRLQNMLMNTGLFYNSNMIFMHIIIDWTRHAELDRWSCRNNDTGLTVLTLARFIV